MSTPGDSGTLTQETVDELLLALASLSSDPLAFVYWAFPWGEPGILEFSRPEPWQVELLTAIRDGLLTPEEAIRQATSSGNGVGKSALVAWIILWAHSTLEDTLGIVSANTETQLKTKTWASLGKWFNLFIAKDLFRLTATSLFSRDPERDRTWRTDAVPWSENNVVAFQGLHNVGRRQFIIFDEASGIADGIWEAADGCMTDANTQRLFLVYGNPNNAKGRFRDCFPGGRFASLWHTRTVDSRSVSFTDKKEIEGWIKAYGPDSDYVRVRVLGKFPRVDAESFISFELAMEAARRRLPEHNPDPVVLGIDVGRKNDPTVIYPRQGFDARSRPIESLHGMDLMRQATRVVQLYNLYGAICAFIDVGGVGWGLHDRCQQLGLNVWAVDFGARPDNITADPGTQYANKRAEIWGAVKEWLPKGCIPEEVPLQDLTLIDELSGPTYGFTGEDAKIQLERKRDMLRRGVPSPNAADALACSLAFPFLEPQFDYLGLPVEEPLIIAPDYNPFSAERMHV